MAHRGAHWMRKPKGNPQRPPQDTGSPARQFNCKWTQDESAEWGTRSLVGALRKKVAWIYLPVSRR